MAAHSLQFCNQCGPRLPWPLTWPACVGNTEVTRMGGNRREMIATDVNSPWLSDENYWSPFVVYTVVILRNLKLWVCVSVCLCTYTHTLTHASSYTHLFLSLSLTAGDTPWQIKVNVHFCAGPSNRHDEGVTQFALWPWPSVPMAHFAFYIHTQRSSDTSCLLSTYTTTVWHILLSGYIHNDRMTHLALYLHIQWQWHIWPSIYIHNYRVTHLAF